MLMPSRPLFTGMLSFCACSADVALDAEPMLVSKITASQAMLHKVGADE